MATLSLQPNSAIEESPRFVTAISEFDDQINEQRRALRAGSRRKWKLTYTNKNDTDWGTFKAFFLARQGRYDSFDWTNPNDSVSYTVRFVDDELPFRRRNYNLWEWDVEIIEVN